MSGQDLPLKTTLESIPVREMQSENETGVSSKYEVERRADLEPLVDTNVSKRYLGDNEEIERLPETVENIPMDHVPRVITRRIRSPVFLPPFNYTDKAFFGGLTLVTIAAFITRLYKLGEPTHVA